MVVVVAAFAPPAAAPDVLQPALPSIAAKGNLVLSVQPATTEVFVDGYYVGGATDFGGERGGAFLDTGPHTIELRAAGYEPVSFDVKIVANESLAYRRELKPEEKTAPPTPPIAKAPTTIYMIPGCYVGNVPPKDAGLPATCDLARALSFQM